MKRSRNTDTGAEIARRGMFCADRAKVADRPEGGPMDRHPESAGRLSAREDRRGTRRRLGLGPPRSRLMDEQNKPDEVSGAGPVGDQAAGAPPEQDAGAVEAAMAAIEQAKSKNGEAAQGGRAGGPTPIDLPNFASEGDGRVPEGIDLLADVNLNVKIELGRTRMVVEDVLRLGEGSVVELDKLAGDPVDVYVNDRHVAKGEVLVLNDNFCVRINEIVAQAGEEAA